jgi:lysyl-tRNA synthetase class 2
VNVFRFVPGYEQHVYDEGKETLFLLFLSFIIAFFLTRLYTRLGRRRGWGSGNVGGIHLHHIVPGIILVLVGGLAMAASGGENSIPRELAAVFFGAGAALVLDEFALVFHLRDVYWTTEGRASIEAAIFGALLAGLLLVASSPFESKDDSSDPKAAVFAVIAFDLLLALVTFLKGKYVVGTIGIFFAPAALVGALRLAKPYSPWARWFYAPARGRPSRRAKRQRKLERARHRFEHGRLGRAETWVVELIGGRPDPSPSANDLEV